MNQTEDITGLVSALSKAQGSFETAKFNRGNPHFKSQYADLASIMDACRKPLSENGLCVMQYSEMSGDRLMLVTMIAHTSGQWIRSYLPLFPAKMDSQGIGSAMTYAKRYSLAAMLGIVADADHDDDGETAVGRGKNIDAVPVKKHISAKQLQVLRSLEAKLDDECHKSVSNWLREAKIDKLEHVPEEAFTKVLTALENAIKYMEQKAAQK